MTTLAPHTAPPQGSIRTRLRWLAASLLLAALPASAQQGTTLIELINAYRAAPHTCQGRAMGPVARLAPHPALSRVQLPPGVLLDKAIGRAGYPVAQADAMFVAGVSDPARVLASLERSYCKTLLSTQFSEIGARRTGDSWMIVFAQPAPPSAASRLPPPREAGQRILEAVNRARASARNCGTQAFEAAPPLAWNEELASTALGHSGDMARQHYFSHTGKDGRMVDQRALEAGYRWRRIGENIAVGQDSADDVVAGWLGSPGHCANVMDAQYTDMGAGYAINHAGESPRIYWTQVLATPGEAVPQAQPDAPDTR
ncbi:CAP domain-containing protein [Massilia antarctica]|uniref:CAP domain-containing protein n=1 Tax=Massilia antarctica TaxID=2765360 RepID=UPI0006BB64B7|nr:CAP domain-containing protein [Massilia sp. H27-R4]MCY0915167.1 CAP domain-containing protein [Massilia sp. H27-R4]CUI07151.1 probable transmembrane protein [Janthinobacterium sp. CG23_2]CUU30937.1 probable transmembrane protein [Janthinobacterium sp. CG23_2]